MKLTAEEMLRKDIYALIRAERERCVKIAEECGDGPDARAILDRIRSGE